MVLSERFYRNQMFGDNGRMKRTYAMFRLDMRCRAHTRLPGWQVALAHAAIDYISRL